MKQILYLFLLALLLIVVACSQQKTSISREYAIDKNWVVAVDLSWDSSEVIGTVRPKYKGVKPLDYVIVEPNFWVGRWPEGYIPPSQGKYTWRAEKPEGAVPDIHDISTRSNVQLSRKPPRIMNKKEAYEILNQVIINIGWKETDGETYSAVFK